VVQFDKEASQTCDYCVAKNPWRASLAQGRLRHVARLAQIPSASSGQALRCAKALAQDDNQLTLYRFTRAAGAGFGGVSQRGN
jgi:hypothetical protein